MQILELEIHCYIHLGLMSVSESLSNKLSKGWGHLDDLTDSPVGHRSVAPGFNSLARLCQKGV